MKTGGDILFLHFKIYKRVNLIVFEYEKMGKSDYQHVFVGL